MREKRCELPPPSCLAALSSSFFSCFRSLLDILAPASRFAANAASSKASLPHSLPPPLFSAALCTLGLVAPASLAPLARSSAPLVGGGPPYRRAANLASRAADWSDRKD